LKAITEEAFLEGWAKQSDEWDAIAHELSAVLEDEDRFLSAFHVSSEQRRRRFQRGEPLFRMIDEVPHEITAAEDHAFAKALLEEMANFWDEDA
jgi:urease accessory protein UreF